MKTKPTRTVKLRTVQSGIEAELREIIKRNAINPDHPEQGQAHGHKGITAIVPMYSRSHYRQGLKDALKVVRAHFESYR